MTHTSSDLRQRVTPHGGSVETAVRVGRDVVLPSERRQLKSPGAKDPFEALKETAELGLDGVLFRTLFEMSPTLDRSYLSDVRSLAAELGLYVQVGAGKVNPYMTAELPEIRELGNGSYLQGMTRLIETAAEFGWTDMWTALAGYKGYLGGFFTNDRYRTDVDWTDQLAATTRFLQSLAPVLRANGVHLDLETHEEVTSFEVVRMVESVGPDVMGITLDTANLVVHAEDPVMATARVAPYVRATQLRDVAIFETDLGLTRYLVPCGEGIIDWFEVASILQRAGATRFLTIEEGAGRAQPPMHAFIRESQWRASHPDISDVEIAVLTDRAASYERQVAAGERPSLGAFEAGITDPKNQFLITSANHLRDCLARVPAI